MRSAERAVGGELRDERRRRRHDGRGDIAAPLMRSAASRSRRGVRDCRAHPQRPPGATARPRISAPASQCAGYRGRAPTCCSDVSTSRWWWISRIASPSKRNHASRRPRSDCRTGQGDPRALKGGRSRSGSANGTSGGVPSLPWIAPTSASTDDQRARRARPLLSDRATARDLWRARRRSGCGSSTTPPRATAAATSSSASFTVMAEPEANVADYLQQPAAWNVTPAAGCCPLMAEMQEDAAGPRPATPMPREPRRQSRRGGPRPVAPLAARRAARAAQPAVRPGHAASPAPAPSSGWVARGPA